MWNQKERFLVYSPYHYQSVYLSLLYLLQQLQILDDSLFNQYIISRCKHVLIHLLFIYLLLLLFSSPTTEPDQIEGSNESCFASETHMRLEATLSLV